MESPLVARELRHDVRNQLFALRTAFAALAQNVQSAERLQRSLGLCASALERLTSSMQEYFALQTGEPTASEFDLDGLITETIAAFAPATESLGIKFKVEIEPVKLRARKLLLGIAVRRMFSAISTLAIGEARIELHKNSHRAELGISYSPKPNVPSSAVEEAISSVALAEEAFGLDGGEVRLEPGRLVGSIPLGH